MRSEIGKLNYLKRGEGRRLFAAAAEEDLAFERHLKSVLRKSDGLLRPKTAKCMQICVSRVNIEISLYTVRQSRALERGVPSRSSKCSRARPGGILFKKRPAREPLERSRISEKIFSRQNYHSDTSDLSVRRWFGNLFFLFNLSFIFVWNTVICIYTVDISTDGRPSLA